MRTLLTLFLLCLFFVSSAQEFMAPIGIATKTNTPPQIDGILNDQAWSGALSINSFIQHIPVYNEEPSYQTSVKIIYDNEALYIAARMFDEFPDRILKQLGNRDEENLNADYFSIEFDTYHNDLDAFVFSVYASGVQADSRIKDETFDAVWTSAVTIDEKGWVAELKIPYSAIRFPVVETQNWKMQIIRYIRRIRETDLWAQTVKEAPNAQVYWGELKGIEKVDPALRLSITPYLSATYEHYPAEQKGKDDNSYSFTGGADLKYGINESFTLDMSLLPDFSQVQSDNQVKNLTAFETVYEEQRPFFKEAVDLFEKGDLFYSRRIGRIPLEYEDIENQLYPGEEIKKNPPAAKLMNATKLSGRTKKGLAIGLFNAITGNTYASIEDSTGNKRKILTDPRSNYNIIVFDQALKNNSSVYLINTSVIRTKDYRNANVTGSGVSLFTQSNLFNLSLSGAYSQLFEKDDSIANPKRPVDGVKYNFSAGKVKGKYQAVISSNGMDDKFSANDMGITLYNNNLTHKLKLSKYQFEPVGHFRESTINLTYILEQNYSSGKVAASQVILNSYATLLNYLTVWNTIETEFKDGYDYYEPRRPGSYFIKPGYYGIEQGYSSDYRKTLALDGSFAYYLSDRYTADLFEIMIRPLVRVSNHFFFIYQCRWFKFHNDMGYAGFDSNGKIIFGKRDLSETENIFEGRYMFKNNLSLNLRFRHYWSKGEYSDYYYLQKEGTLSGKIDYHTNTNFNFNAFTADLVLWWEFAPGSRLNLIWKNSITKENSVMTDHFWRNFKDTWESPQDNSLTVKFLYYLDYQYLKKKKIAI